MRGGMWLTEQLNCSANPQCDSTHPAVRGVHVLAGGPVQVCKSEGQPEAVEAQQPDPLEDSWEVSDARILVAGPQPIDHGLAIVESKVVD